jgi:hypothetical protein
MLEFVEYGVFQVGQIWLVTNGAHDQFGFTTAAEAIAAANARVAAHLARGEAAKAVILDEIGRLIPAPGSV